MKKINYDEVSKVYDDVRSGSEILVDFLIERAGISDGSPVLEIGCGTGNYLRLLREKTGIELHGLDSSEGMLTKAMQKIPEGNFKIGDAVTLDGFPNDYFELIYMVDVIHHIQDIETMFANTKKILKKGGTMAVFTDSHERITNKRLTSKYFPETIPNELKRYQPIEKIVESMYRAGFDSVEFLEIPLPEEKNMGEFLIETAGKKAYSMFYHISEEAIKEGIKRLEKDMAKGEITYKPAAATIIARK